MKTYVLRTNMSPHNLLTSNENPRYENNVFNIKNLNENIISIQVYNSI